MDSIHAVAAYCAEHTTAEAAAHFGVNERTIRKWKARASADSGNCRQSSPELAPIRATEMARIPDAWIARDGQLWKCPVCGELMPPIPGTSGLEWNTAGCYLHQVAPAPTSDPEAAPAPEQPIVNTQTPAPAPIDRPTGPARPPCRRRRYDVSWDMWIAWGQSVQMPPAQVVVALVVAVGLIGVCYW